MKIPGGFLIEFAKSSLRFPHGNLIRDLQTHFRLPISHWFWKGYLKDSIWKFTRSSTDSYWFSMKFLKSIWKLSRLRTALRLPYDNCTQMSYWFGKDSLKISIWKLTNGSPNQNPIDFARNSSSFIWESRAVQTDCSLIFKGIPKGFHMEIVSKLTRQISLFCKGFLQDLI